ncbi:type II toxin-antitoxin system HipA family toxin [Aliarcobacter butzleri]|uniref:Type II toxin-antitoxin system HipA family toxin n=1 Tax=Aliarcobacter butzleri TaxID=28197 RepID=A0AAW7QDV2_9BACT|nr:type II toxin-antitoxin system HipA family toxin [Aliarcobacter butzleri]MDN5107897.1 type II toxin-antitoxin system HipA family toxin [Aliarcobacter butzleri]MDN5124189.1 type II toxin-antitoxin system HipA family toxin [Aliarcobacter butzleri]
MRIKPIFIAILEELHIENKFVSLKFLINKLDKYKPSVRTLQANLKELVESNRVITQGSASTTEYAINDIISNYKRFEFIYVLKDNEIAGILFKLNDRYRFYYDNEFLINKSKPIPSLDLQISPFDFNNIPAVFEENIPEGINREILETTSKTADEFKILTMLEDNIGDLSFTKTREIVKNTSSNPPYSSSLNEILGTNPKINVLKDFVVDIEDEILFPDGYDISKLEIKKAHGISGFQYKKLVNIDMDNKKIVLDDSIHAYILKPYSKPKANKDNENYFPHISLNEHLFMSFAKNTLGFRVPFSAIVKNASDEEYHYIVKRFDRFGLHRYAKSTFAVFMGLRSDNKYDTTSERLFERIAKELINPRERMELLKHYVYSIIIQHEDMHTKNLSLIYDRDLVFFAPLYDVSCTGLYDTSKGYDSHLTINGKQSNIRPNDFKPLCERLGVDFKAFKEEAHSIAKLYETELPSYIEEIKALGSIPFYKKVQKTKIGEGVYWKASKEPIEFHEVLNKFHKIRVEHLKEHSWIID